MYIYYSPQLKKFSGSVIMSSLVVYHRRETSTFWGKPSSQLQIDRRENFVLYENVSENFVFFFLYVLFFCM